ncbi:SDR family oxidoreductase [Myxococcota bacterium]|nr:SDR family oxidoreductase [Myxococcota bacterium]
MNERLRQRVLITGASSGIGESAAQTLSGRGHRVFGTARAPHPDSENTFHWLKMDVCEDASVETAISEMLSQVEGIDAVVCNAGMSIFGAVEDVSIQDAKRQFETNFFGVLRVLRNVLPVMRAVGSGRVLLVGSLAGRAPIPFQAHYSASKAAIDALASALANEMHSAGVRVVLIEPGDIQTPFNDAMAWDTSPSSSPYSNALARVEKVVRDSLPVAPPPQKVADKIVQAIESRRPRARYTAGAEAGLVPFAKRLLPDRINLALIRRHFDL